METREWCVDGYWTHGEHGVLDVWLKNANQDRAVRIQYGEKMLTGTVSELFDWIDEQGITIACNPRVEDETPVIELINLVAADLLPAEIELVKTMAHDRGIEIRTNGG